MSAFKKARVVSGFVFLWTRMKKSLKKPLYSRPDNEDMGGFSLVAFARYAFFFLV